MGDSYDEGKGGGSVRSWRKARGKIYNIKDRSIAQVAVLSNLSLSLSRHFFQNDSHPLRDGHTLTLTLDGLSTFAPLSAFEACLAFSTLPLNQRSSLSAPALSFFPFPLSSRPSTAGHCLPLISFR